jgi:excisionase family DNA binding protein
MNTSKSSSPNKPTAAKAVGAGKKAPSTPRATASHAAIDAGLNEVTFLTVAEVAAVMRVSKMTVYRLVHSAELPAVRVGRSFRVPDQAVHDYLQAAFVEAG